MSDYLGPCPVTGCPLGITTVGGLAPGGVCPAHGAPDRGVEASRDAMAPKDSTADLGQGLSEGVVAQES